MYSLPTEIEINGNFYPIRQGGDYRLILQILKILNDEKLVKEDLITGQKTVNIECIYKVIIIFFDGIDDVQAVGEHFSDLSLVLEKMFEFINCGKKEQEQNSNSPQLIDWEEDEMLIVSAVNNVARCEVRALEYLHWWTFIAYYMSVGECSLSYVVGIRGKIAKGKKLEKHEQAFKRENKHYFINKHKQKEDEEIRDIIMGIWNNK